MSEEAIRYESADGIARIVMNRPEMRNALTDSMFDDIIGCLRRAEADDDVKVVVLGGEGPSFCAGFDLTQPDGFYGGAGARHRYAIAKLRHRADVMKDFFYSMKPTIASVHGHCIGVGTYLVLVANLAIASDDAVFGFPEERFGSAGTTWVYPFLASQCGLKKANEVVMTGRKISADEAERLNIVNRVVARDDLEEEVGRLAEALCSLPREGLAVSRSAAHLSYSMLGVAQSFEVHSALHPMIVDMTRESDEFNFHEVVEREGLRTALERRNERFGGRYWDW